MYVRNTAVISISTRARCDAMRAERDVRVLHDQEDHAAEYSLA